MEFKANWVRPAKDLGDVCPVFKKEWKLKKPLKEAALFLTARGVYEARINGKRVSGYVLAPGWTSYEKRLQVQRYDITELIREENILTVTVGRGWMRSPMPGFVESEEKKNKVEQPCGLWGELHLTYEDGNQEVLASDETWEYGESAVRFSEIYDGERYDAAFRTTDWDHVVKEAGWPTDNLIMQEGEEIREIERIGAKSVFETPAGERVVDFGQEITGYVEFSVDAKAGERIRIFHGEMLDKEGNFYRDNYRDAKAEIQYICKEGKQTYHPVLTFFGFRYLKLEEFPGEPKPEQFTAVVVCSNLKKTGRLNCSDPDLNQLFSNIFWGQKGNFLDIPTDCPQRDERLGWTGDAQVFVKTASYNYDVEKFFTKWLHDMAADQRKDGGVGHVIPDCLPGGESSAAWGDAAVICPWQIYLTYGNKQILEDQFDCMKKWVDYITGATTVPYLWAGGVHFGDWLGLDAPSGSYKGSSREEFIATAFYARSTQLLIKAAKVLGKDGAEYERLYGNIVKAFRETYPEYLTQTEHILAVHFGLARDLQKTADDLAEMIKRDGGQIKTGFVGTPYILHVLSEYGHSDLAYTLFLRKEYPSWLFSVKQGATTIWEHWDGIMENGDFWSKDMNSFNHYAYGSVADWVYEKAAGIRPLEEYPGFSRVLIKPMADRRLKWLEASIDTRSGRIASKWICTSDGIRYEIETAVPAVIQIEDKKIEVAPGTYTFWS